MLIFEILKSLLTIHVEIHQPLWTDVCQAIGSLATFGAFVMLFIKDKNKQAQLDKLASIAGGMEAQNEILKESNRLLSLQLDVHLKNGGQSGNEELLAIEKQKLLLSVKPKLWLNGAMTKGNTRELLIQLANKGERAYITGCKVLSGEISLNKFPDELEKSAEALISAQSSVGVFIQNASYEIEITYRDELGTEYRAIINGKGPSAVIKDKQ